MKKQKQYYWLCVASRAEKNVPVERKHALFFEGIRDLPEPWGLGNRAVPPVPNFNGDVAAVASLKRFFGKGVRMAQLLYPYREDFADWPTSDDTLSIVFDPTQVDLSYVIYTVIPKYILALDAYFVECEDEQLGEADAKEFEKIRDEIQHPDDPRWNPRFSIQRVGPVSFYDELLCRRAFNLFPSEVADRLHGKIEDVQMIKNGVYFVGSSKALSLADAQALCQAMKNAIIG